MVLWWGLCIRAGVAMVFDGFLVLAQVLQGCLMFFWFSRRFCNGCVCVFFCFRAGFAYVFGGF